MIGTNQLGTIITNFEGPYAPANEANELVSDALLNNHAFGPRVLSSVWVMVFAIIRSFSEQLDFAFGILDPVDVLENVCTCQLLWRVPFC